MRESLPFVQANHAVDYGHEVPLHLQAFEVSSRGITPLRSDDLV